MKTEIKQEFIKRLLATPICGICWLPEGMELSEVNPILDEMNLGK